jgi:3-phosphoshikimate 1-carboxyvinyltransferase
VVTAIKSLGGEIEEFEDGFAIEGPQRLRGATIDSAGDHRIAMAFTIAGLVAEGTTEIMEADCAAVSFPEFYELLASLTPDGTLS